MCSFLLVQGPTLLQLLQPSSAGSHYNKIHFSSHILSQPPQDWDCPSIPPNTKAFVIPTKPVGCASCSAPCGRRESMSDTDISPGHCTCQAVQASVHILLYQNIGTAVPAPLLTPKFQFHLPEARGQKHTNPTSSGSGREGKSDTDSYLSPKETEHAPSPRQKQSQNHGAESLEHTLCARAVAGVREEQRSSGSSGRLVAVLRGGSSREKH